MIESDLKSEAITTESSTYYAFGFWFVGLLVLVGFDQLSKYFAQNYHMGRFGGGGVFLNENFAFSLELPAVLMHIIYAAVLGGVFIYLKRSWHAISNLEKFSWVLVLAGGLSNIGERLMLGHVRDFIPVLNGILNVADFYIIFGLVLLLITSRKKR